MARQKEFRGNLRVTTLNLDEDLLEKFEKTLPRNKSVSLAIREHIESVVLEAEKNREAPISLSPIRIPADKANNITITQVNESLDKFMKHICTVQDPQEAAVYEGCAHSFHQFVRQRVIYLKRK